MRILSRRLERGCSTTLNGDTQLSSSQLLKSLIIRVVLFLQATRSTLILKSVEGCGRWSTTLDTTWEDLVVEASHSNVILGVEVSWHEEIVLAERNKLTFHPVDRPQGIEIQSIYIVNVPEATIDLLKLLCTYLMSSQNFEASKIPVKRRGFQLQNLISSPPLIIIFSR